MAFSGVQTSNVAPLRKEELKFVFFPNKVNI